MSNTRELETTDEIAIIGMTGRFPGANNISELWRNLSRAIESISFFTDEELLEAGASPSVLKDPNCIKARGIIPDVEFFDASFFDFTRREAEITDPQQRLFLECAWEALEGAGYNPQAYAGRVGVYAGVAMSNYLLNLYSRPELVKAVGSYRTMIGNDKDYLSTMVSYKLNLRGPSINVQTACSTSLVAVHLACQSLLNGECDMALAGGVSIGLPQKSVYFYREGGINSRDGHCRAFDSRAEGTVGGSGVGVVILQRHDEALADRDYIYAVIKGSAVNNDGAQKVGYTAPSVNGQASVIADALAVAGVAPESISYVEAHGTGTVLGDPIEVSALTKAFRTGTNKKNFCGIGSIKTNIGHLDTAAGVAGLIKTALALKHKQLPPSLNFETPNPKIDLANSPFYVCTELKDWKAEDTPLRAGVSSFGIGGTNVHLIVEESPAPRTPEASKPHHLLILSAKTNSALETSTANLIQYLEQNPTVKLPDVAYTLQVGRAAFSHRRMLVAQNREDALQALAAPDAKRVLTSTSKPDYRPVIFMFPGQGSQHVNMARELFETEPIFREQVDKCIGLLPAHLQLDLRKVLYIGGDVPAEASTKLAQTYLTQPALFIVEYALARLWMSWGIRPEAMIGHSVGEYVAACLAGVFSLEDALMLVVVRGELMQGLPRGAMLAVALPPQSVEPLLGDKLALATVNGPSLCVVSGQPAAIEELSEQLQKQGVWSQRLQTSHAFHSPMMEPILRPFMDCFENLRLEPPQIPYASNLTGAWITDAEATDANYWARHLRETVRFADGLHELLKEPQTILLEVGPGQTLSGLAKQQLRYPASQQVISSLPRQRDQHPDAAFLLGALGQLWLAGVQIDWPGLYTAEQRCRLPLPTYPFERERYWIDQQPNNNGDQSSTKVEQPKSLSPAPALSKLEAEPIANKEPEAVVMSVSQVTRRDTVLSMLNTIVMELTGATPEEIDIQATFFELGVDSLLLIQSSQSIQDRFGVKVPFGQLFEELSTIDALATHLDSVLPPDKFQPEAPAVQPPPVALPMAPDAVPVLPVLAPPAEASSPMLGMAVPLGNLRSEPLQVAAVTPSLPQPNGNGNHQHTDIALPAARQPDDGQPANGERHAVTPGYAMEGLMIEQLRMVSQLTSRQLELLHDLRATGVKEQWPPVDLVRAADSSANGKPEASTVGSSADAAQQRVATSMPAGAAPLVAPPGQSRNPEPYVPFKPIQPGRRDGLTPRQQQHLDGLIKRYTERTKGSKQLTQTSRQYLADSRVSVGFRLLWKEMVYPIMAARSLGSKVWDVDGNEYVDVTMGFGVHLFGHSPGFVMRAMEEQMKESIGLGPQMQITGQAAQLFSELANVDRVNFCNSGTEAVMGAMRVARTVTRRNKIALFSGAYHGWADANLIRGVPSPDGTMRGMPSAPGVSPKSIEDMMILEYDNQQSFDIINKHADEIAAVLVEPVQSRRPDLQPRAFLQELRRVTERNGTLLIFDEMITGFRSHPGGAQAWFGVQADLATYGKVIGGGLPIGAIGGRATYMDTFDGGMWNYGDNSVPVAEKTLFAGAFFKHPLTMAMAHAVLQHLKEGGPQLQQRLNERTTRMVETLNSYFERNEVPGRVVHFASLFRFVFPRELKYSELFFYHLGEKGILTWEGGNLYLSTAHTDEDVQRIIKAVIETVEELRDGGFFPDSPSTQPRQKHIGDGSSTAQTANPPRDSQPANLQPSSMPAIQSVTVVSPASVESLAKTDSVLKRNPNTRMQFSLYFFGNYDAQFSESKYRLLFETVKYADQHGFTAVWLPERHFNSFGGFSPNPSVLAAALARETERIQIRAGSVVLPLHNPIRVAEEWSLVDNLSKGRVGVSFASGWHPNDFAFAPDAYDTRHKVMHEGIETVRRLWRGGSIPVVDGTGSHINVSLVPMPMQAELPIWLTVAHRDTAIKAGQIGASFLTNFMDHALDDVKDKVTAYRQARAENCYDPEAGHVTIQLHTFIGADFEQTLQKVRQPFKDYMRASFKLVGNKFKSQGRKVDLDNISEADLDYILTSACEQYMEKGALIGTPATCSATIDSLLAAGVNEVTCLVDFGLDLEMTLESLHHINELRQRYEGQVEAGKESSTPITVRAESTPNGNGTSHGARLAPLTEMQKQLWTLIQMGTEVSSAYNESITLRMRGEFNVTAMRSILQKVVDRHEALRTTFSPAGDYQLFNPTMTMKVPLIDLSTVEQDQRETELEQWLARDIRQPFDLVQGPLLRARIVRMDEQDHLLLLTNHHIIFDGDSVATLMSELSRLYEAECEGRSCDLPVPLRFSEYAERQVQQQNMGTSEAEAHWLEQWTDSFPILELPTDRPRAATFSRALYCMSIDGSLYNGIRALSSRHRATMFVTMLAGFKLLLHQLTGQRDIIVGINTADSAYARRRDFVGYRVFPVMVRTKISGDPSFSEFFAAVRKQMLDAYEHQHVSLTELFKSTRMPGRLLPVTVGMNLANEGGKPKFGDLDVEAGSFPTTAPALDLYLDIAEKSDELLFRWNYNPDLFDADTVRDWMQQLHTLLEAVVADPAQPLSALPGLPSKSVQPASSAEIQRIQSESPPDIYQQSNLTKYQLLIWLGQKLRPNVPMYINAYCFTIASKIEREHLQEAFQAVVDRSDALRTIIQEIDGAPHQNVLAKLPYEMRYHDFSEMPDAHGEAQKWVQERCRMPLDISKCVFDSALIKLSAEEYLWYLNVHHLVADAWASALIARLVSDFYQRSREGKLDQQSEIPLFQDYVDYERQYLSSPESQEAQAYWKEKLAQPAEAIAFYGRTALKRTTQVQRVSCDLGAESSRKLKEIARREGIFVKSLDATLTNIFGALLYTYLYRISGTPRLSLGIPYHNRQTQAFRETIGLFIQIMPHRITIEEGDTFLSVIDKLMAETLENRRHLRYPVGNENQAYDVEYNYINATFPSFCGTPSKFQWLHPGHAGEAFGFQIHDFNASGSFVVDLDFHQDVFDEAQYGVAVQHFLQVVDAFIADPTQSIHAFKLLTPEEERHVIEELNQTERAFPTQQTFSELFEAQVEKTPHRRAVVADGKVLTYAELNARANRLAHRVRALGVGPDVVVGLLARRNIDLLTAILGILKAGGAYLPLDPLYPAKRLAQIAGQANCALFLSAREFAGGLSQALESAPPERRAPVRELEELFTEADDGNPLSNCGPQNLSYLIYTSGSTGVPKAAMIEQAGMVNHLFVKINDLQLTADDEIVEMASQCFDISVWQFLAGLLVGACVHIVNDEVAHDAALLLDLLQRERITVIETVPSLLHAIVDEMGTPRPAGYNLSTLRWMVVTGEALPPELCRKWLALQPEIPLLNAYGPTECSDDVTHYACTQPPGPRATHLPIGRAVSNIRTYVLDQKLLPVPVGIPGELLIGGVGVGRGYWNDPGRTAEVFIPDPFSRKPGRRLYRTGDRVRTLPNGNLEFLGRLDNQVKVRGHRIELGEIEAVLVQHPAVDNAAVLILEGAAAEKKLVAYVMASPSGAPSVGTLRDFLKEQLPAYMIPSGFVVLEKFPLTPSGKTDRRALLASVPQFAETEGSYVAPRNQVEQILADIWASFLGLGQVSVDDNFFDLGGDSILSIQVAARANQAGLRISPLQIFLNQTVAQLATVAGTGPTIESDQGVVSGPVPLTPIQKWFFEQNVLEPHHWNQAVMLVLRQQIDPILLEQAIQQLLVHHDALRLRFIRQGSGWAQFNAMEEDTPVFSRRDLSQLPEDEQSAAIEAEAARLQANLNLEAGPLARVALFELGDRKPARLLLIIHHLVVDGVSWRILLEDLMTGYEQLSQGGSIQLPPKTSSFKQWAERLAEYAQTAGLREELDYWLNAHPGENYSLPVDNTTGENTRASGSGVTVSLTVSETEDLLRGVPEATGAHINDVLLTALAKSFSLWTGERRLQIDLEGHGREWIFEEIDLSRTAGWFTTVFPVHLELGEIHAPLEELRSIKEGLKRIPGNGIGYGLLRYLSDDEEFTARLAALPPSQVSFNYLGQFDQVLSGSSIFGEAHESAGPTSSALGNRLRLLDVNAFVSRGQLRVEWTHSRNVHDRATIEDLAQAFIEALRSIIVAALSSDTETDFTTAPLADPGGVNWNPAELDDIKSVINRLESGGLI